jgi:hypothetical protein
LLGRTYLETSTPRRGAASASVIQSQMYVMHATYFRRPAYVVLPID